MTGIDTARLEQAYSDVLHEPVRDVLATAASVLAAGDELFEHIDDASDGEKRLLEKIALGALYLSEH